MLNRVNHPGAPRPQVTFKKLIWYMPLLKSFHIPRTIWISPNIIKYRWIREFWLQKTICPIWKYLESPPVYFYSALCNLLQNSLFMRQIFFGIQLSQLSRHNWFCFFIRNYTPEGTRLGVLSSSDSGLVAHHPSSGADFLCPVSPHIWTERVHSLIGP